MHHSAKMSQGILWYHRGARKTQLANIEQPQNIFFVNSLNNAFIVRMSNIAFRYKMYPSVNLQAIASE